MNLNIDAISGTKSPELLTKKEKPETTELPVLKYENEIRELVKNHETSIIRSETGSGKTTRVPLMLLKDMGENEKIAITQPRRVAAVSVARYVASEIGTNVGDKIGFQVRFDDHTNEGTRINFMTDGILITEFQRDPLLKKYSAVMIDEAHERSLNIDYTLGLCKRAQRKRIEAGLPELKIVVASATLEQSKFNDFFPKSGNIEIAGRTFSVEKHFEPNEIEFNYKRRNAPEIANHIDLAIKRTQEIIKNSEDGDILIFMPGQKEIDYAVNELNKLIEEGKLGNSRALPLHGQIAPEDQDKVFKKTGKRKIIVATNIAETSITIDGVKSVVDLGFIKQTSFDPETGITDLRLEPHSKSGLMQRAGRAGRTQPGDYYFIGTEEEFDSRNENSTPEIQRTNLSQLVLSMKKIGIDDVENFDFIDSPSKETIDQAISSLEKLGALDNDNALTSLGKKMAEMPIEPHISRMILEADKFNCTKEICTIASFIGGKNIFVRPTEKQRDADKAHEKFKKTDSDFISFLEIWKEYEANGYNSGWARENFLNSRLLIEAQNIQGQLFDILRRNNINLTSNNRLDEIGKCITTGLSDNIMVRKSFGGFSYEKPNWDQDDYEYYKPEYHIHPSSGLMKETPKIITCLKIIGTTKDFAHFCQEVKVDWIKEYFPQLIKEDREFSYDFDDTKQMMVGIKELHLSGTRMTIAHKKEDIANESMMEEAKKFFIRKIISSDSSIDNAIVKHNQNIVNLALKYKLITGNIATKFDLEGWYEHQTSGEAFYRISDLERLKDKIWIKSDEILPDGIDLLEIEKYYPDYFEIDGKQYKIEYKFDERTAKIKIPNAEKYSFKAEKLPTTLGVFPSKMEIRIEREGSYYAQSVDSFISSRNKEYNEEKWREWRRENSEKKVLREMTLSDTQFPSAESLGVKPIEFGKDLQNRPLIAYPIIFFSLSDLNFKVDYNNEEMMVRIYTSNNRESYEAEKEEGFKRLMRRASADRNAKYTRKYDFIEKKDKDIHEKIIDEKNNFEILKRMIDSIDELGQKPTELKTNQDIALSKMYEKKRELKRATNEIERLFGEGINESNLPAFKGKLTAIETAVNSLFKRQAHIIIPNYNKEVISDTRYILENIKNEIEQNPEAIEYINEQVVSKEALIGKVEQIAIDKIPEIQKRTASADQFLNDAVNEALEQL